MCSTTGERLARIGTAIDELAAEAVAARTGQGGGLAGQAGQADQADDIADRLARLARLWEMVADLDPELARRLPGYGA
jgi:hypothetical protein